jgi:hypothetical protein
MINKRAEKERRAKFLRVAWGDANIRELRSKFAELQLILRNMYKPAHF